MVAGVGGVAAVVAAAGAGTYVESSCCRGREGALHDDLLPYTLDAPMGLPGNEAIPPADPIHRVSRWHPPERFEPLR
jgi:hypothetical protein